VVLLVEDELLVRISLRRFLEGRGYRVLAAASPAEARILSRGEPVPDVLLTDMVLPETSGRDLADELRRAHPRLRVVFMSANPMESLIDSGRLTRSDLFLEKPFEIEDLERVLCELFTAG
jgi:CheY-like chemotaxis protein